MAYTAPTYTNGNEVDGSDLRGHHDALRKYVNKDIAASDLAADSVGVDEIVRGERMFAVPGAHRFPSGDVYGYATGRESIDHSFFTCHVKSSTIKDAVHLVPIKDAGATFHLEETGVVIIHATVEGKAHAPEVYNYEGLPYKDTAASDYAGNVDTTTDVSGDYNDSEIFVELDGEIQASTLGHCVNTSIGTNVLDDRSHSTDIWRAYDVTWKSVPLAAGLHTLRLVVDPVAEVGFFMARSFVIRTFYRAG